VAYPGRDEGLRRVKDAAAIRPSAPLWHAGEYLLYLGTSTTQKPCPSYPAFSALHPPSTSSVIAGAKAGCTRTFLNKLRNWGCKAKLFSRAIAEGISGVDFRRPVALAFPRSTRVRAASSGDAMQRPSCARHLVAA
jgi:hypothetical protein